MRMTPRSRSHCLLLSLTQSQHQERFGVNEKRHRMNVYLTPRGAISLFLEVASASAIFYSRWRLRDGTISGKLLTWGSYLSFPANTIVILLQLTGRLQDV